MATSKEDIEKLLGRIEKAYKALGDRNPFKDWDVTNIKNAESTIQQLETALEGVQYRIENTKSSFSDLSSTLKAIVKEIDPKAVNSTKEFSNGFKNIIKEAKNLKYEEEGINKLSKKQLEQHKEKILKYQSETKLAATQILQESGINEKIDRRTSIFKNLTDSQKSAVNFLKDEESSINTIIDKTNIRIKQEEKISELMGIGGSAVSGVQTALDKLGFGGLANALGLDEVNKKMRETAEELEKNGANTSSFTNKFKVLKAGVKEAGTQLLTSLKDPIAISKFLVDELIKALTSTDKLAGDTAKSFNMSYRDALALNTQLTQTANLTADAAVNTRGLNESVIAVGKSLGSNAVLNEKDLITFTKLREQAGYTNDELIGIQKISLVNGKTLEDNTAEILGAAEAYAAQNKLVVNEKDVLREVSKASAALKLSLKGGASALAESVVKSKQFGLNLEQADKIASGLLNFEQSISNELEAELLTGKNLNFEQARYLALNGKTAEAAAEIARQVGTSADFANMNRIQQEAIANAAGLTREELAQSLIDREALVALSGVEGATAKERFDNLVKSTSLEEAKKRLGNDQLALQFQQQSVAERFNNTIEKLRELFVSLAEPILQIVSPFMNLVTNILPLINVILAPVTYTIGKIGEGIGYVVGLLTEAKDVAYVLAGVFGSILLYQNRINISKAAGLVIDRIKLSFAKKSATTSLGGAVIEGIASVVKTPIIGPLLAAAAAAGVYALGKKYLVDDAMSPGYGKRVLSAPEGTYAFNDNDTIVAGTNLEGNNQSPLDKNIKSSPTSQINLTPLVDRMMAVEKLLTNILNKEGVIYIDSTRLGTAVSMGTYKTT
jgi:hypothetical protein